MQEYMICYILQANHICSSEINKWANSLNINAVVYGCIFQCGFTGNLPVKFIKLQEGHTGNWSVRWHEAHSVSIYSETQN